MDEHSAGAIVFRGGEKREYLVLHYEEGHWSLPKGKIEPGEQPMETAKREIFEETNLNVEFVPSFHEEINYFFRRGNILIRKKVDFFLAKAGNKNVKLSFEHIGYRWLRYEDALKQLGFDNDRNVLRKAEDFLNSTGNSA
ncbi:MAG: NUDIX domain-containing protein [Candidatus Diapherotrites archaeon]|nr:NUDIX domain-containing protein [Candidatus Diapherotrites archaeon]